jgi:PPK2 family polyphosphate:nucleotide phosphotransferase
MSIRKLLEARPVDGTLTLASSETDATPLSDGKKQAKNELEELGDELFDLHELMFANESSGVLLVLQGTDASGKNGTIKHVINRVNPAGVLVTEFGPPTEEEQKQHFLERIRLGVPGLGRLGVFARSHYEDVIIPIAERSEDDKEIDSRFKDIAAFESELTDSGIRVVKCLLNISYDEQRERFLRRLRRPDKRWKFAESDVETRRKWDEYQMARGEVISRTTTVDEPWYVIPADNKWYRNWAIAKILEETLREMDLEYPQPDLDLDALREALDD